ncbi:MAG TPA: cytochrome c [Acidimicrobiia bacterium]|nr:cytochrome c [Acidimicrobiia bacterium]
MRRLALAALALALAGCGGTDPSSGSPSAEPELIEKGRTLYAENCAECHGEDLRGTDQGPSFLSPVYEPGHHGDGAFLLAVQAGVRAHHWKFGDMPPVEGLTPDDVEAIVAFVRETQRTEGFEP